ncbi:MAG: hypothetical protein IKV57_03030 [Clostridia bacterium]|nr:hypothetical protein [Clostridia bacterium]
MKKFLLTALTALLVLTGCGTGGISSPNAALPPDASAYAAQPLPDSHAELQQAIWYITHAAGAIDGMAGSNSLEALTGAYEAGCRYIEIDFQFTADGDLACIHDWYRQYTSAVPEDGTALTLEAFQNCRIYDKYTPLWLDSLADFMTAHPDLYIITDIKTDNPQAAAIIGERYPELTDRFIIQIYNGDEYDAVREAGFDHIIYTLYMLDWNSKTDTKALCEYAAGHPLLGFTFSYELCDVDGYVKGMMKAGIPLYVHTVNGDEEQLKYFEMGISGIYTDEWK